MFRLPHAAACALLALSTLVACSGGDAPEVVEGSTTTGVVPGASFAVTGTADQAAANQAVSDPIATPFTITVAERGVGGAEIDGATSNGKPVQINWEGGQPLPVRGPGPGLKLNAVTVRMADEGIVWALDGAARDFVPGTYTLGSSVAVGTTGLARPVDSVTFVAGEGTTLSTTGSAVISEKPREIRLEGDNSLLVLTGSLLLSGPNGDRNVNRVNFGPGRYEVTLTPTDGGYDVDAKLEGRVIA
jgi:hypothetical protein